MSRRYHGRWENAIMALLFWSWNGRILAEYRAYLQLCEWWTISRMPGIEQIHQFSGQNMPVLVTLKQILWGSWDINGITMGYHSFKSHFPVPKKSLLIHFSHLRKLRGPLQRLPLDGSWWFSWSGKVVPPQWMVSWKMPSRNGWFDWGTPMTQETQL